MIQISPINRSCADWKLPIGIARGWHLHSNRHRILRILIARAWGWSGGHWRQQACLRRVSWCWVNWHLHQRDWRGRRQSIRQRVPRSWHHRGYHLIFPGMVTTIWGLLRSGRQGIPCAIGPWRLGHHRRTRHFRRRRQFVGLIRQSSSQCLDSLLTSLSANFPPWPASEKEICVILSGRCFFSGAGQDGKLQVGYGN